MAKTKKTEKASEKTTAKKEEKWYTDGNTSKEVEGKTMIIGRIVNSSIELLADGSGQVPLDILLLDGRKVEFEATFGDVLTILKLTGSTRDYHLRNKSCIEVYLDDKDRAVNLSVNEHLNPNNNRKAKRN